jgi:hypothetical protein
VGGVDLDVDMVVDVDGDGNVEVDVHVAVAALSIHQLFSSEIASLSNSCAISEWVAWPGYEGRGALGCALRSGAPGELIGFGRVSAQWSF